ncbi:hypothetical protein BAU16_08075 [Enterococcus sp. JM9B]|nr:hypothetical protein BAU16_08075 [Enterococcus sp. JM9B]
MIFIIIKKRYQMNLTLPILFKMETVKLFTIVQRMFEKQYYINEDLKLFYYRGLKEWEMDKEYLMDTCLSAQDRVKKQLDYFRIEYQ